MRRVTTVALLAITLSWAFCGAQAAIIAFDDLDGGETGFAPGSDWGSYSVVDDLGYGNNLKAVNNVPDDTWRAMSGTADLTGDQDYYAGILYRASTSQYGGLKLASSASDGVGPQVMFRNSGGLRIYHADGGGWLTDPDFATFDSESTYMLVIKLNASTTVSDSIQVMLYDLTAGDEPDEVEPVLWTASADTTFSRVITHIALRGEQLGATSFDNIQLVEAWSDLVFPPPVEPPLPPVSITDVGLGSGSSLELSWHSQTQRLYDLQMTTDPIVPPLPTVGTPIQFAFGSRVSPIYTVGTDGPAHQKGTLQDVDDRWNGYGATLGTVNQVEDPTGVLIDTRGNPLPGVACDFGSSTNGPIDWDHQPQQSGSAGSGMEFQNDLYRNNLITDGRNDGPMYLGVSVTGLAPGDYEVYALTREPSALSRIYGSSIGVITAADLADGIAYGDPGLNTVTGTAAEANGVLDEGSEYVLENVTVSHPSDAVVVILTPDDTFWTSLNGLQIVRQQLSGEHLDVWTTIVSNLPATPPANTYAGYTPSGPTEHYRVLEKPPLPIFFDDFEDGMGGWSVTNIAGTSTAWELGTPNIANAQFNLTSAYSGDSCWGTALTNNYMNNSHIVLRSPAIDLTGVSAATLSFLNVHDMEGLVFGDIVDFGEVNILSASDPNGTPLATNITGRIYDLSSSWGEEVVALPAPALGTSIVLEFIFVSDVFNDVPRAGWYIDDVAIR